MRNATGELKHQREGNIDYATLDLSREDHAAYYNGFANRTLWPLLHFRLDLVDYSRETYAGYRRVNAMFADRLAPLLRPDDVIWIHDYHLIPLGQQLRERGIANRIGFFLHVPMPSSDLLGALPEHSDLFDALSSYDLVGFQTVRDVERFQDYVRLYGGGRVVTPGRIETAQGRRFRGGAFPISIDTGLIARQAADAERKPAVQRLRASLGNRVMAIGVDRLDYSKDCPTASAPSNDCWNDTPTSTARSPTCRSRRPPAATSPSTRRYAANSKGWPATSTVAMPRRTGRRCATSTGISRTTSSPGSTGPRGSDWSRHCATA